MFSRCYSLTEYKFSPKQNSMNTKEHSFGKVYQMSPSIYEVFLILSKVCRMFSSSNKGCILDLRHSLAKFSRCYLPIKRLYSRYEAFLGKVCQMFSSPNKKGCIPDMRHSLTRSAHVLLPSTGTQCPFSPKLCPRNKKEDFHWHNLLDVHLSDQHCRSHILNSSWNNKEMLLCKSLQFVKCSPPILSKLYFTKVFQLFSF
jgi:hypothetical protein